MIKFTSVGIGGNNSDSYCSQNDADSYSGISNMGKKEERVHAELQAEDFMHDARRCFKTRCCMNISGMTSMSIVGKDHIHT